MDSLQPLLATCSNNGLIVYDCQSGSQLLNTQPHNGNVNSLSWSHNGQVIATSADDGKVILTLVSKAQVIETLMEEHAATIPIHAVGFSSNSLYIGSGSADGAVKIWNLKTRTLQVNSQSHNELVYSVAWNSNDSILASGSMNGAIALHTTEKSFPIDTLTSVPHAVRQLKFSPFKTEMLGASCDDGSVELWDVKHRVLYHSFSKVHTMSCTSLAFSAVNHMLLCSSGLDQKMAFYDTSDKRMVKQVDCPAPITSLSFHADGYTIAAGTLYGTVMIYDLRSSMDPVRVLKGHANNPVNCIEFTKAKKGKVVVPSSAPTVKEPIKPAFPKETKASEIYSPVDSVNESVTSNNNKSKWKSIEDIREQAKRNVELRKKGVVQVETEPKVPTQSPAKSFAQISKKDSSIPAPVPTASVVEITSPPQLKPAKIVKTSSEEFKVPKKPEPIKIPEEEVKKEPMTDLRRDEPEIEDYTKQFEEIPREQGESSPQRVGRIEEVLAEFREEMHKEMTNMHVELIRQFQIQIGEIQGLLEKYAAVNTDYQRRMNELEEENERLKRQLGGGTSMLN